MATRGYRQQVRSVAPPSRYYSPTRQLHLHVPGNREIARASHLSPDRITRGASPCGRSASPRHLPPDPPLVDNKEIISRVPQMYRTSFSAITAPRRCSRKSDGSLCSDSPESRTPPTGLSRPSRATSRGRSASRMTDSDLSGSYSLKLYSDPRYRQYSKSSKDTLLTASSQDSCHINGSRELLDGDDRTNRDKSNPSLQMEVDTFMTEPPTVSHMSIPDKIFSSDSEGSYQRFAPSQEFLNGNSSDHLNTNNCRGGGVGGGAAGSSRVSIAITPDSSPPMDSGFADRPSSEVDDDKSAQKLTITKEYIHHVPISYLDLMGNQGEPLDSQDAENILREILAAKGESSTNNTPNLTRKKLSESAPNSPSIKHNERRRGTDSSVKDRDPSPFRKSLSTSITNFLRRMSPKVLRRSSKDRRRHASAQSSPGESIESTDNTSVASEHSVTASASASGRSRSKSPKMSPIKRLMKSRERSPSKSPKHSPRSQALKAKDVAEISEPHCTKDSSVENPSAPKQMPSSAERILKSMDDKPEKNVYQAFKDRQSPKRAIEGTLKPCAVKVPPCEDDVLIVQTTPQMDSNKQGDSQLSYVSEISLKPRQPPKSLNVREVAKLSKTGIQSMTSSESIGDCSLDITGSEPSIASGNGHQKKTYAQDSGSTAVNVMTTSDVSSRNGNGAGSNGVDSTDNAAKVPSYLRLSCSVSGYNKYSTYVVGGKEVPTSPPLSQQYLSQARLEVSKDGKVKVIQDGRTQSKDASEASKVKLTKNGPKAEESEPESVDHSKQNGFLVEDHEDLHNHSSEVNGTTTRTTTSKESPNSTRFVSTATVNIISSPDSSSEKKRAPLRHPLDISPQGKDDTPIPVAQRNGSSPVKDGHYYLRVVQSEEDGLLDSCHRLEKYLDDGGINEEAAGQVRAVIGKATLLITKKFKQFRGLCQQNINQAADEPFTTTAQDLAGFWDMVMIQVDEVKTGFLSIDEMSRNGWKEVMRPRTGSTGNSPAPSGGAHPKISKTKPEASPGKAAAAAARSAKAKEAAKIREEARKRLMAAKRAGRRRVASQSSETDIEIFIPE